MFVKRHSLLVCVVLMLAGMLHGSPAWAQGPGVQGGFSVNPDQFFIGAHYETAPLTGEVRFRPGAEAGFGDHTTVIAINGDFILDLPEEGLYVGGGPAINIITIEFPNVQTLMTENDTSVEPGLNFMIGFRFEEDYWAEIKIGAIDSPEVKFVLGYTWHR